MAGRKVKCAACGCVAYVGALLTDEANAPAAADNVQVRPRAAWKKALLAAVAILLIVFCLTLGGRKNGTGRQAVSLPGRPARPDTPGRTVPPASSTSPARRLQPLPPVGDVRVLVPRERQAPLEVVTGASASQVHYLVKLVDVSSRETVMTIFTSSGQNVKTEVPLGSYEVRYATGVGWYGYEDLFGPETACRKADSILEFRRDGDKVSGYTIKLYSVLGGNLKTTNIPKDEF